jgi:hypothetical protein
MRFAFLLAFLSAVPGFAIRADSLQATLDATRADARSFLEIDTQYDIPWQRVAKAVSVAALASTDARLVVDKVAKSLGVTKDVAAAVVEIHLRSTLSYGDIRDPDEQKRVGELLQFVRQKAAIHADAVAFCIAHDPVSQDDDQLLATYLPLLRAFSPAEVSRISGVLNEKVRAIVVAEALGRAPDDPQLLQALTSGYDSALHQTFGPVRVLGGRSVVRESWQSVRTAVVAREGSRQIAALAGAGRAADAVAAFDALPKRARDAILAEPLDVDGGRLDVRLDLAASALLTGDAERARILVATVHPAKTESYDPLEHLFNERRMLETLLNSRTDPDVYDVLADTLNSGARPSGGVWSLIFAEVAARGGYEDAGAAVLRAAHRWTRDESSRAALAYLPEALRGELQATLDADAAAIAAMRARVPSMPSSDAIQARLAAPRLVPFEEKPLPESLAEPVAESTIEPEEESDCSETERIAGTMSIPSGWFPIRLERAGDEVAGIALSTDLDPMGEVGLGAYWVLHSDDGGLSWDPPLYTGLRENAPYAVRRSSKLPLLHGDRIQIAVDIREIDPDSISFPPVGLRVKREVHGLYLDVPWEALRRDSDLDGVTDLVEERMATDPRSADTDSDGIIDGDDALPLVPLTAGVSRPAEVLAAILGGFRAGSGALVVGLPSTEAERSACVARASAVADSTLFVVGDRQVLAPLDLHRRVVVLSPDELEAYSKKFGMTLASDFQLMIVRRDGLKALVVLNSGWKEDVLELTKTKDGWKVRVVGGWIS